MATINFIIFDQTKLGYQFLDGSHALFSNSKLNRIHYRNAKKGDINYLPLHIRTPYDIAPAMETIPNELYLLMQQGIVRPLIMMLTEAWDIFDTYLWTTDLPYPPDFGNVPYSNVIKFFTKRSIPEENVTWVVPNHHHVKQIKFLQEKGYKISCKFLNFDYNLETLKLVTDSNDLKQKKITKHFSCLLNGTPRNHRYAITYELWRRGLIPKGNVSICEYANQTETKGNKFINDTVTTEQFLSKFDEWQERKEKFKSSCPMVFDGKRNEHWLDQGTTHLEGKYNEKNIFESSFLWLASETKKTTDGIFITEKTWKAIAHGNPFCINGDAGSIKYLKDRGYKTFDKFWDESYDTAGDVDRVKIIAQIVEDICKKTLPELQALNEDMLPILEHNQMLLKSDPQWENLMKDLANA